MDAGAEGKARQGKKKRRRMKGKLVRSGSTRSRFDSSNGEAEPADTIRMGSGERWEKGRIEVG